MGNEREERLQVDGGEQDKFSKAKLFGGSFFPSSPREETVKKSETEIFGKDSKRNTASGHLFTFSFGFFRC
jgi:hypothetical protein